MAMGLHSFARGRRGRGGRAPMAEINVTPLVDVMLVLLIIFMVTAPLLKAGVPIELPESRAKALAEEKEQLTVSIDRDGTVFLDNEALSPGELPERLAEVRPGPDGNLPLVTLRAHRALEYGRVIGVMGELNHAGFNSISLVTVAGGAGPVVSAGSGEAE